MIQESDLDSVFNEYQRLLFEMDDNFRVDSSTYKKNASDVEYVYYTGIGAKPSGFHTLKEFLEIAHVVIPNTQADWLNMIGIVGACVVWKKKPSQ